MVWLANVVAPQEVVSMAKARDGKSEDANASVENMPG
jgi:hypothetical protein